MTTISRLPILDRFLPVWILLAMILGLLLGLIPNVPQLVDLFSIGTINIPIAIGLLWMMYPVLARVKYEKLPEVAKEWKLFGVSLALNWLFGPILMFILAWVFLPEPQMAGYRMGLIIVGLARCIAMVLVWNLLAEGDNEKCAILVAINSILQVLLYALLAFIFVGPQAFGAFIGQATQLIGSSSDLNLLIFVALLLFTVQVAITVLIFLGIPLAAGVLTRGILVNLKGGEWYETRFIPKLAPTTLLALLFTIVVMFSLKGGVILAIPIIVLRVVFPLLTYFAIMFGLSYGLSWILRFRYTETVTLSFTAASNNFELAIAVAVGVFGLASDQALATVVGPLVEVPVLISLVYVALWSRRLFFDEEGNARLLKDVWNTVTSRIGIS